MAVKDEDIVALKEQTVVKDSTEKTNEEVTDAMSQRREKQIMVEEKEIKDQEKEIEVGKDKEKKKKKKLRKIKMKKRVGVKKQEKRGKKKLQRRVRKCHIPWYLPRKIRTAIWQR